MAKAAEFIFLAVFVAGMVYIWNAYFWVLPIALMLIVTLRFIYAVWRLWNSL